MIVSPATVAQVEAAPNFAALLAEYAAESAMDGMPPPQVKMESYRQMEAGGLLHVLSATNGGELIGFLNVLVPVLPHYGVGVAISESFFVAKAHRKTGAGLALLKAAEELAASLGLPLLLVSAPIGGDLAEVLPRVGYSETSHVFAKRVAHA